MASIQPQLPDFTLLTDLGLTHSDAWGLHAPNAEHPSPATFIVGRDGTIKWRYLGDRRHDWPKYDQVAAAL